MTGLMHITPGDHTRATHPRPAWRIWSRLLTVLALVLFVATEPTIGQEDAEDEAPSAVAASAQIENLAIITIEGPITAVTSKSFQRRYKAAIEGGADGIVVEINSPGGEVGAVLEITDVIKQASVPTIAWINNDAYSGGAIIAIACDEIVLATNATMGDAAPIRAGPMGLQNLSATERSKILSPLLSEVVDSARRNGYDEILITSLIMLRVETWLIENVDTGQRYFLTEDEYKALFGEAPVRATPLVSAGGVDPSSLAPLPTVDSFSQGNTGSGGTARLPDNASPSLRALSDIADEELIATAALGINSTSTRPDFAKADPDDYRFIQYATDGNALLTLKEQGLRSLGFTHYSGTVDNEEDIKNYVAATKAVTLDQSWSEDIVEFATQGTSGFFFRAAMIVIFLLGLFIEMAIPGVGVAGVIAILALAGLVVPPMMIDASAWWTVVAILGGIGLIALEIFVIPGFGVAGILGLVALVGGLIGTFASAGELFPGAGAGSDGRLGWAIATVFLAIFGAGVGIYFFSKYTRSIPVARSLMLNTTLATFDTSSSVGMLSAMDAAPDSPLKPGDTGRTTTDIRPEGEAEFEGEIYDVSTPSGWIARGTDIRVVEVRGNRITIVSADAPDPEGTSA